MRYVLFYKESEEVDGDIKFQALGTFQSQDIAAQAGLTRLRKLVDKVNGELIAELNDIRIRLKIETGKEDPYDTREYIAALEQREKSLLASFGFIKNKVSLFITNGSVEVWLNEEVYVNIFVCELHTDNWTNI